MKKSILLFAASGLLLTACQNFKKAEGGLEYKIAKDAGAEKAVSGDLLAVDIIQSSDRDSTLSSTYETGTPQIVQLYPDSIIKQNPGDPTGLFKFVGEGDSLVFKINLDSITAKTQQPKPPFADKYIIYTIKVQKHFKKGKLTDQQLGEQVTKYYEEQTAKLKGAEAGKVEAFLKNSKLATKKTASGLQYAITKEGTGKNAAVGDTVVVNYLGKLANDKVFDTNQADLAKKHNKFNPQRPYEPLRLHLGVDGVITGWTEAFQLLNKGSKATLVIPSNLAYGERQAGEIPAYSPLIFDVEVLDIIPGKAPAAAPTTIPATTTTPATPVKK
ncbi:MULTISPECIES: FKBP-type peptidyl-prolyl cis-trans isomerase [unclassified Sphingobacterium]|uniref:FKBP-type peptidyl-prolyl cis-trans isomerase n=1 Tax=unclassified Sphingobacterium TaxID=2609468 RepID=UPI0010440B2E|nr:MULTISPECIES: FKBP-type peptidyl-prolyl cis-trans isomerase [unclassified Sphingobacterium]MCS3557570.1 FKBP-type peptidyl-prolyl cis-trans isomerase [Sphingobacterium sp. JUb21]TCQ95785.1 FKBP-type peptidyl-prolyl isomerase-like protein [Sphingobacterium sp. JUb20]